MTEIYVRKTGNDTTGDGTTSLPYLTIAKAITVAVAGDVIYVGAGTYAESNGSGRLTISTDYASMLTITSETGRAEDVTITGTSSDIRITGSNVTFQNVTLQTVTNAVLRAVYIYGATVANVRFVGCTIRVLSASGAVNSGVTALWTTAGESHPGIEFIDCKVVQVGPYRAQGIYLDNTGSGSTANVTIVNSTVVTAGYAVRLGGVTDTRITGNRLVTFGPDLTDHCLLLGADATTGAACSGVISGNTVWIDNSHALLVGAGCDGVDVIGNDITGGKHASLGLGLVVKQATNVRVLRNAIRARGAAGLYFKAADNCEAFDNDVVVRTATGIGLRVDYDSTNGDKCSYITARRNTIRATAGAALDWGGSSVDSGGSICDENAINLTGTATLGTVYGIACTTLRGMRAAWAAYDHPHNDRNTRLGATEAVYAGTPTVSL